MDMTALWHYVQPALVAAGYIAICVLIFSLSIAIHEFGHFIAALKLGYRVERFSIGFGPAIWKKTINGIEYRISWILFGGYVSIPDVDPEGTKALEGSKDKGAEKKTMPPWKDLVVAVAGPAMNIVLAVVLAVVLYFVPSARFGVMSARVGDVIADSPAEKGGLLPGDEILSIGGNEVSDWTGVRMEVQFAGERDTEFKVLRDGEEITLSIVPKTLENGGSIIGALSESGEAAQCAAWMPDRNPVKQILWDAGAVFRALKGLVTPKEMKATGKGLGGPVLIAQSTYRQIRRDTWDGIGFLRFINTNLAVMNLLPIPVLDGGLILFSLIAIVFRRRVPEKVVGPVTNVFMYLLVGLMLFLAGRDAYRIYKNGKLEKNPPTVEEVFGGEADDANAE